MSARGCLLVAAIVALAALPAAARERVVQGEVVDVVPVRRAAPASEGPCEPARPPADAGLAAVLSWDLRARCGAGSGARGPVVGYRVYYRWDERTYSRVVRERPGPTVPLRVRVR